MTSRYATPGAVLRDDEAVLYRAWVAHTTVHKETAHRQGATKTVRPSRCYGTRSTRSARCTTPAKEITEPERLDGRRSAPICCQRQEKARMSGAAPVGRGCVLVLCRPSEGSGIRWLAAGARIRGMTYPPGSFAFLAVQAAVAQAAQAQAAQAQALARRRRVLLLEDGPG
jgi:hypothetical protein